MVVLVVESATPALRGKLTRWFLEVHPGVFVGRVSRRVRDLLWEDVQKATRRRGSAVLAYPAPNEQGYAFETVGDPTRLQVDFDGLVLMRRSPGTPRKSKRTTGG